jgi:hypothetical protein
MFFHACRAIGSTNGGQHQLILLMRGGLLARASKKWRRSGAPMRRLAIKDAPLVSNDG